MYGLEILEGSPPGDGGGASRIQKESILGIGLKPISRILLQGVQALEGVASLGFLPVSNDEERNEILLHGNGGLLPGCRSPATVRNEPLRDFGPKAARVDESRACGGEVRCSVNLFVKIVTNIWFFPP